MGRAQRQQPIATSDVARRSGELEGQSLWSELTDHQRRKLRGTSRSQSRGAPSIRLLRVDAQTGDVYFSIPAYFTEHGELHGPRAGQVTPQGQIRPW